MVSIDLYQRLVDRRQQRTFYWPIMLVFDNLIAPELLRGLFHIRIAHIGREEDDEEEVTPVECFTEHS